LFCPEGRWAIDADVTRGPNGKAWLTLRNGAWTRNGFTALGVSPLAFSSDRRVRLERAPRILLDNRTLEWTYRDADPDLVKTIENPSATPATPGAAGSRR
jgi:hypothetical protein